jgi:hypothetical protein
MDQYGEPNPPTIGNSAEKTATVNVDVVDPVLNTLMVQPPSTFEQNTVTVNGTYTDRGTVDSNVVTIDWGDGTASTSALPGSTIIVNQLNHTFTATHFYADPPPLGTKNSAYIITAQVFAIYPPNAGEHFAGVTAPSNQLTTSIVVKDVPPTILTFFATDPSQRASILYNILYNHVAVIQPGGGKFSPTFMLSPGDDLVLSGSFSDVGPKDAPFTVSIDWGQGTITLAKVTRDPSDPNLYDFTGTLSSPYQNDGEYIVSVTVTNAFTNSATVVGKFAVGLVAQPSLQQPDTPLSLPIFAGVPNPQYRPGLTYNPLAGGPDFFDVLLLSGGGAYGASDTTGSINLLTADQGIEMVLPPAILQNLPRDATQLSFDWGDGTVTSADPATIGDHQPGHIYTQDSGKGTFPLAIIMKGPDGKTTVLHYHVKVFQVAPAFNDTQWGVVSGRNGDHIDITGQLAAAGVDGSYTLSVTWSDGAVTEQTIVNGPNGWTFTIERPAIEGLRPVSITVTDPRNPSNVSTFTFGAPRFGGKTGKQGSLEHRDQAEPSRFAGTPIRDLALVLGAGAAALAPRTKDRSDRAIHSGPVMLAGVGAAAGGVKTGEEGKWLCIDGFLAAKLAGYERVNSAAETRADPTHAWRLPDDWRLAAAPSREAQALAQAMAQAMADVIGDNDEWVVRDGNGDLLEAAE